MNRPEKLSIRETISPAAEKWIKVSAILAMIVVAISSAILSFDGLQKVALASQIPKNLAFLFPIAVDTTILMGSLAVLLYELFGVKAKFGWFTVLFGTVLSITGNVISVKDAGIIAQVLHGIIPVLLCLSLESLLRILRFNIKRTRAIMDADVGMAPMDKLKNELPTHKLVEPTTPVDVVDVEKSSNRESITPSNLSSKGSPTYRETPALAKESPVSDLEHVKKDDTPIPHSPQLSPPMGGLKAGKVVDVLEPETSTLNTSESIVEKIKEPSKPASQPVQSSPIKKNSTVVSVQSSNSEVKAKKPVRKDLANVDSEFIERCKVILESLPVELSKARKVAEIFRMYPDATHSDIKLVLGEPAELRIDGTVRRAKEFLKNEAR